MLYIPTRHSEVQQSQKTLPVGEQRAAGLARLLLRASHITFSIAAFDWQQRAKVTLHRQPLSFTEQQRESCILHPLRPKRHCRLVPRETHFVDIAMPLE